MLFHRLFFHHTAPTELYTLSLHDALPIFDRARPRAVSARYRRRPVQGSEHVEQRPRRRRWRDRYRAVPAGARRTRRRSEEHTSELQSRQYLVCRLLLEKKNKIHDSWYTTK